MSDGRHPSSAVSEIIIRRQEAVACERADKAEKKVIRLSKKYWRLVQEKGEICISSKLEIVFPHCRGMGGRVEEPSRGKPE